MIHAIPVIAGPWSEAMWRASWQGAIAVAVAWAICRAPRIPPALRCWVWRAVYLKLFLALIPFATVELPVLRPRAPAAAIVRTVATAQPFTIDRPQSGRAQGAEVLAGNSPGISPFGWPEWLMLLWAGGAVLCAARLAICCRMAARDRDDSRPVEDQSLLATYRGVAQRFGIVPAPELRVCNEVGSPRLLGTLRPLIIVPAALTEREDCRRLELLLAHELAHHIRRDLWWSWLPALGRLLFWFHPAIWAAERQWRLAEESACDHAAIAVTNAPAGDYARMLLDVASRFPSRGRSPVGVAVVDSRHTLKRRLLAMRYIPRWSGSRQMSFLIVVSVAAVIATVPWRLVAQQPPEQSTDAAKGADQSATDAPSSRPVLRPPLRDREAFMQNRSFPDRRHLAWQKDNIVSGDIEAPFADVSSRTAGVVVEVKAEEGQSVKQGDLMVVLDDARAKAALAEAEAQYKKTDVNYQRLLSVKGAVTSGDIQIAAADRDIAAARLQIAKQDLDETRLTAPMSGIVTSCIATAGRVVSRGEQLAQIMDLRDLTVRFFADGAQYPFLHRGQKVRVIQPGLPDRPLAATITFIAPTVDSAGGRLRIKATVQDPDHRLKPGMPVDVDLQLYREEDLPH